jgi:hypothetical protein
MRCSLLRWRRGGHGAVAGSASGLIEAELKSDAAGAVEATGVS